MGVQRRSAVAAALIALGALVLSQLPIKWHSMRWGTVPEWVGVALLLVIAVGVWRLVRGNDQAQERSSGSVHTSA